MGAVWIQSSSAASSWSSPFSSLVISFIIVLVLEPGRRTFSLLGGATARNNTVGTTFRSAGGAPEQHDFEAGRLRVQPYLEIRKNITDAEVAEWMVVRPLEF